MNFPRFDTFQCCDKLLLLYDIFFDLLLYLWCHVLLFFLRDLLDQREIIGADPSSLRLVFDLWRNQRVIVSV